MICSRVSHRATYIPQVTPRPIVSDSAIVPRLPDRAPAGFTADHCTKEPPVQLSGRLKKKFKVMFVTKTE